MKNRKHPCQECPFSRACEPGTLGSKEPATTYVGQAAGPFWLPCHLDKNYDMTDAAKSMARKDSIEQCAGAAIYRANTEVAWQMPDELHSLPPDPVAVFAAPAELLAHHNQSTLAEGEVMLRRYPVLLLLMFELEKVGML